MKNIIIFLLGFTAFAFSSCSIYEDVYIKSNGSVNYSMMFDASELLAMVPNMANSIENNGFSKDSVISFADAIKEKVNFENLSDEDKADIKNLSPFLIKMKSDTEKSIFNVTLSGDFKNMQALNDAVLAFRRQQAKQMTNESLSRDKSAMEMSKILNFSNYSWDGKTLRCTSPEKDETDIPEEDLGGEEGEILKFFSQGKIVQRFHLPRKITNVNNPDAMLSQDGKTVIIEYAGAKFMSKDHKIDLEINTK